MTKNSLVRRKKKVTKVTKATNVTNVTNVTNIALEKLIAEVDNIAKKFLKTKKGKVASVAGGAGGTGIDKGKNYYVQVKKLIIDNKDKIKKLKETLIYDIFVIMTIAPNSITNFIQINKENKDINKDRARKFLDIITEINSLDQTHINNIIKVSSFSSFPFKDKLSTLVMINILIDVYNSNIITETDKIDIKDIKFELNKGEEKLIEDIKDVYKNSDDTSYDLLRFYNDINRLKNKYELITDIDNLSQLDPYDRNYETNYKKMVSSVVDKLNSKFIDTNKKLEQFKGYIKDNDFKEDITVLSSENINKKFQYYNGIKRQFGIFKKEKEKENKIYYGILKTDVVTDKNINDCVETYNNNNKNVASYNKSLNQLYYILDNEYRINTHIFKQKRLEDKDTHMKEYMLYYMSENYKKIEEIDYYKITPFNIIDKEHNYLIVEIKELSRIYNEHINDIKDIVINSKSLDDILKHNNKLITFRDNYFKNIGILLDNIKEKYRDYIKIYISECNSSTQSSKQNAMDVLYGLLHKINIATFEELVTIKDTFKNVEKTFKRQCIPNIGFDTNQNTDELIKLIISYNVNKLTEKKLEQGSPVVVQEGQRKASNNVVPRLLSEYEKQSADSDEDVISGLKEQLELGKKINRKQFDPFPDIRDVPTPVQPFSGNDDLTATEAIAAARREASSKGGKLAANYKSYNLYKSTGKFVYILYKKKRIKRCVYVKVKGRGKYCKIDKEYILLSKLKVV